MDAGDDVDTAGDDVDAGDDAEDDGERWDAGDGAVLSAAPSSRFFFPFAPEPPLRKAPLRKEAEAGLGEARGSRRVAPPLNRAERGANDDRGKTTGRCGM